MARRSTKEAPKKSSRVKVNFEGVETRILLPEGIYNAEVHEVEMEDNGGKPYLKWTFKTIDDDPKLNGKSLYNNTSLQPQSLWVLGSLLDTLGVDRPDGEMDIDLEELKGLTLGLVVEHEDWEGKTRSKVVDFTPDVDEGGDVTVDDDTTEDSGDEKYTEEDVLAMDMEELEALVEKHDLTVKKSKKLAIYAAAVVTALEEEDLIGEAETAGDTTGYTEDEILEADADALDAIVEASGIDVKADKKLSKYRAAVLAALEEADLISADDEKYTEDEISEMDADELKEVAEKHDLTVKWTKKLAKDRSLLIDALEAADLIADDGADD